MKLALRIGVLAAAAFVTSMLIWQGVTAQGAPDPLRPNTSSTVAFLDIGILVFREGLECILVLAAITASMTGPKREHRRPVAFGAAFAFVATLITWCIAVRIVGTRCRLHDDDWPNNPLAQRRGRRSDLLRMLAGRRAESRGHRAAVLRVGAGSSVAGSTVKVRAQHGVLSVWRAGQLLVSLAQRARSGAVGYVSPCRCGSASAGRSTS